MAFVSITPAANSIVATGDALVVTWDTATLPWITFRPSNATEEVVYSPQAGGMTAGPGFTVASDNLGGGLYSISFKRDAGWTGTPFVISFWDQIVLTETQVSYTLLGEGQYPPDMQPFNDPVDGGTAGVISIQDNGADEGDATTLNFANNLDVTVSGGTATIVGAVGGVGGGDVSSSETSGTVLDAEVVVFDSNSGKLIKGAGPAITADPATGTLSATKATFAEDLTIVDGAVVIEGDKQGVHIQESAFPTIFTPGFGLYWVRSDATQSPIFTDDQLTNWDLRGGTVSDGNTSTTLATDGVIFGATPGAPATYSLAPEQKSSSFSGDDVSIAGGENIGTNNGGSVYIRGGASSGSGVNGGVYIAPSNTTELFLGGAGTDLRINDGTSTGTAGYGLMSDGTSATWQPNSGGGATDTVSGSNGVTNTGDNTDAILTPTYGSAADTVCQGNDSRLSNSRDPNVHASSHENGSGDEIDVTGLSGLLADPQTVGIEDSGTPDTYDATVLNFGTNMTVTVDAADGTATVNASVSGSVGVNGLGSWNYDNTLTSADPGSGNFRLDNLNPNSATAMYIDSVNGDSQTMDTVLANAEGWRLSFNNASGAKYFSAICGTPSDQTGWWSIPLSDTYGTATLTNTENHTVTLAPSDSFASAGAAITDNAIVRGDGGGSGVQDSSVTITDGGAVVLSSATSMVQVPERATGPTFAAGTGQFWVKNTSPSSPFFTQDDGTELDLTPAAIGTDTDAIHVDVSAEISGITEKVTPIAADLLVIEDSAASNAKKRVQIGNLPFVADEAQALVVSARSSAGTINPGQVVYLTGWDLTNGVIQVDLADASAAATMPGFGIAQETITSAATGQVVVSGEITDQVTTGYTEGDFLYVSETAGALTDTKPTGTAIVQHICVVNRAHATEGVLQIVGAGQPALPSIAENNVWMGSASGMPTETARAGIDTDSAGHIALTANPHSTSMSNIVAGTLLQLNAAVGDATLDDISGERTPSDDSVTAAKLDTTGTPDGTLYLRDDMQWTAVSSATHASEHEVGGSDLVDHDALTNYAAAEHRVIREDTTANRGAASSYSGEYFYSTDDYTFQRSDGTNWQDLGVAADDVTIEVDGTNGLQVKDAGVIATTKLSATGTKSATTFLRGDDTWADPGGTPRTIAVSVTTGAISANVLVEGPGGLGSPNTTADLLDYDGMNFVTDVEIYVNGVLQRNGADLDDNFDVYPATLQTDRQAGAFFTEAGLSSGDTIQMFYGGGVVAAVDSVSSGSGVTVTGTAADPVVNLQQMGQYTIKGNNTGSQAYPINMTPAETAAMLSHGDLADVSEDEHTVIRQLPTGSKGAASSYSSEFFMDTTTEQLDWSNGTSWINISSSGSGDEWGDAVDSNIVPDAAGTRSLGTSALPMAGLWGTGVASVHKKGSGGTEQFVTSAEERHSATNITTDFAADNKIISSTAQFTTVPLTAVGDIAHVAGSASNDGVYRVTAINSASEIEVDYTFTVEVGTTGTVQTFAAGLHSGLAAVLLDATSGETAEALFGQYKDTAPGIIAGGVKADGSGDARMECFGGGSNAIGWVSAQSTADARLASIGEGSTAIGFVGANDQRADILATKSGSFAGGMALDFFASGDSLIESDGNGTMAFGVTLNGSISATASGAVAMGYAMRGTIEATGIGSFAFGFAVNEVTISASAANSAQWFEGSNSEAESLQVGDSTNGIRLCGSGAAPSSPQNGDIWVASGKVYVRTNGVSRLLGVGAT